MATGTAEHLKQFTKEELIRQVFHGSPSAEQNGSGKRLVGIIGRAMHVGLYTGVGSAYYNVTERIKNEEEAEVDIDGCFDPRLIKAHLGGRRRRVWKAAGGIIATKEYDLGPSAATEKVPWLHYEEKDGRLLLPRVGADSLAEWLRVAVEDDKAYVKVVLTHTSLKLGLICGKMKGLQEERQKRNESDPFESLEEENQFLALPTVQANHNTFNLLLTDKQRFEGKEIEPVKRVATQMVLDTDTFSIVTRFNAQAPAKSETTATLEAEYRDLLNSKLEPKIGAPGSMRGRLRDPRHLAEFSEKQDVFKRAVMEEPELRDVYLKVRDFVDRVGDGFTEKQKVGVARFVLDIMAINYLADTKNIHELFAHFQPKFLTMSPWGVTFDNLDPGWQRFSSTPPAENKTVDHMTTMWSLFNEKERHAHELDPHHGRNRFHSLGVYPRQLLLTVPANPLDVTDRTESLSYKLQDLGRLLEEADENRFLGNLKAKNLLEIYGAVVDRETGSPLLFPNFPFRRGQLRFY